MGDYVTLWVVCNLSIACFFPDLQDLEEIVAQKEEAPWKR